ncbi:hypothetical protein AVEN_228548-1 [Araneus ventricosus]|uniref:Uncharacterized protein n=1 Tax=Araneus ventricosus TaxID=182803 RepID=A0A4Y2MYA9_ARAVE|nr:hypothetical protein AVEN_228548-1 [Araneus ventricosus]
MAKAAEVKFELCTKEIQRYKKQDIKRETRVTVILRQKISLPDTLTTLVPREVEKGETDWAEHLAECPTEKQISLVDGGGIASGTRIYTDGSKNEKGVGEAFCVWPEQNILYRWLAKLQDYNTVFQAELLALKHATDHATSLPKQPITILVDNQARTKLTQDVETQQLEKTVRALSLISIYTFLGSKLT